MTDHNTSTGHDASVPTGQPGSPNTGSGPIVGDFEPGSIEWHSNQAVRAGIRYLTGSIVGVAGFVLMVSGWAAGVALFGGAFAVTAFAYRSMRHHAPLGDFDPPVSHSVLHTSPRYFPEAYLFRPKRWRRMWLRAGHQASTAWIVPALNVMLGVCAVATMLLARSL